MYVIIQEEFAKQATAVVNGLGVYMWGANKRALANAAAWKDLAKRITTLQAEVFHGVVRSRCQEMRFAN